MSGSGTPPPPKARSPLEDIRHVLRIDERLITSGQPTEEQLRAAAREGVEVVINLGLHDDPRYALPDEAGCVSALGMIYVHIPVDFGSPSGTDLTRFSEAMDAYRDRRVLVHCAANKRVTAFLGLHRVLREGATVDAAFAPMRAIWEPNAVWQSFIDTQLSTHGRRPVRTSESRGSGTGST